MNSRIKLLIELQNIDTSIISIENSIKNLDTRVREAQSPLQDGLSLLELKKNQYEIFLKKKRDKEADLADKEAQIQKMKDRTSDIKTNKEYLAHMKEIEAAEEEKTRAEEDIITFMEKIDSLARDVKEEESRVTQLDKVFKSEEKKVEKEKQSFLKQIESYKEEREKLVQSINNGDYNKYMTLYNNRNGKAVVETKNEVCLGCHMNIPPQLFNDVKKNEDILLCAYCNRILYYVEESTEEPPEKKKKKTKKDSE